MNLTERLETAQASLIALGIIEQPLEVIMTLVKLHMRPDMAQQISLALSSRHTPAGLGEIAGFFLRSSLRRKDLIGRLGEDPAWNMLLALFADEQRGTRTSVSSACHASGSAPSTALRQVDALLRAGIIDRVPDHHDGRRSFLSLNDTSRTAMATLIRSFCVTPPAH